MVRQGFVLEETVEKILQQLQANGAILRFVHHPRSSPEDRAGKDFTVVFSVDGKEVEHSFGVTISQQYLSEHKMMHPNVIHFCWPIGTNPSTMEKRILELASKSSATSPP